MFSPGGITTVLVIRATRYLAPAHVGSATLLIVGGGLIRIFAGHVEVYAFLFVALAAYLWTALLYLCGRTSWPVPCLALGVAVWLHLSALCLIPSLVLLPWIKPPTVSIRRDLLRGVIGVALVSVPLLLFLLTMLLFGHLTDLTRAWSTALEIAGIGVDRAAVSRWLRGWSSGPSIGTDYVILSLPHLKYLINAAYVLAPALIPALLALAVLRPRSFVSTPVARFLFVAGLPLLAYSLVLRPVWGPFDWDVFAITAFFWTSLTQTLVSIPVLAAFLLALRWRFRRG